MFFVERLFAITFGIVILDVVVDERRFMEAFNRDGNLAEIFGKPSARRFAQCLERGDGQERPPSLSGASEPFATDLFGIAFTRTKHLIERLGREPRVNLIAHAPRSSRRVLSSLVRWI